MAEIVSAVAMSHILMSPHGVEEKASRVVDGMIAIGRKVRAAKPDVIVIVSNDHLFNIELNMTARFLVGRSKAYTPFGEMDIPRTPYPGHPDFADGYIAHARNAGYDDLSGLDEVSPDHGMAVPLLFATPDHDIPVVPLYVNLAASSAPSPARCWSLGEVLRDYVRNHRPANERVAVIAGGGLSHWVGFEGKVCVNEDFDHRFLADFAKGNMDIWRQQSTESIVEEAGNGGLEIVNWLLMAATVPNTKAEVIYYESIPEWMTGMAGIAMRL